MPPTLTHLVLWGASDMTKAGAGFWSKDTKVCASLKKPFISSKKVLRYITWDLPVFITWIIFLSLISRQNCKCFHRHSRSAFNVCPLQSLKKSKGMSCSSPSGLCMLWCFSGPQTVEQERSRAPKDGCASLKCCSWSIFLTRRSLQACLFPHPLLSLPPPWEKRFYSLW